MPGLAQKDGGGGGGGAGGGGGVPALCGFGIMDYCTTGNNVLSHLGKLLSCLGDFEIH